MSKDIIITIQDLLKGRNTDFDASKKIKLVRHKKSQSDDIKISNELYKGSLYNLYRTEPQKFLTYQSEQKLSNFDSAEYIVSFIGEEGTESRFVGVYKNNGHGEVIDERCVFDFVEVKSFEILKERVIIDWGSNAISWHQWYDNIKNVIRIDRGLSENDVPVFTSYNDVLLSYSHLKKIFDEKIPEWKNRLDCCNCIYLIQDTSNGKQYVGSTYNKEGIWGRWEDYASTGHGGDVELIARLEEEKGAENNFQWTILEILPLHISADDAIDRETLYKQKFCTRKFGYNSN